MDHVQLEFNIAGLSHEEVWLSLMQKQIDHVCESAGKVRRRLFSEIGEMKKICAELKNENHELKTMLKELRGEKTEWLYVQGGSLFEIQEYRQAIG